ncbi:MAG: hypothetical protein NT155_02600 [Candidatus Staskawiczbacteria bacterium]|nr:hypothetical protein [Candidatus Staskawiczbacteria bacterium]
MNVNGKVVPCDGLSADEVAKALLLEAPEENGVGLEVQLDEKEAAPDGDMTGVILAGHIVRAINPQLKTLPFAFVYLSNPRIFRTAPLLP